MMKAATSRRVSVVLGLAFLVSALAAGAAEIPLDTEDQKTLYAVGLVMAHRFTTLDLSDAELAALIDGLADGVRGEPSRVAASEYQSKIQGFLRQRLSGLAEREAQAGKEFRDKVSAEPGAVTTDSGLIYFELAAGDGPSPVATDSVLIHYHGKLRDGTVFDSSRRSDEPATFVLAKVVSCFSEGLVRMKVGGKSRFVCPPELAYRDVGSPPKIRPGATIEFEVELLEILPEGTAGTGHGPGDGHDHDH
ncbi:MAG: FKBP-type peptidyl-prolyl cis-trans isomerase [bacterium]|nr:FKBP-type peptidyl-prolyl cis-trans isomerase [bacterium]